MLALKEAINIIKLFKMPQLNLINEGKINNRPETKIINVQ